MTLPLSDVLVVEIGERLGAGLCGGLLAQLGADVVFLEGKACGAPFAKWRHRTLMAAGKLSCEIGAGRKAAIDALLAEADIVITSSDLDSARRRQLAAGAGEAAITCDITAFGDDAPHAGHAYSDAMVQARSGLMVMTGETDGPPAVSAVPLLENSAALYAAAGILLALRVRRLHGAAQSVAVALYDCALNFMTTFLPVHYDGGVPRRLGNGHALVVPWNSFETHDGMVQICGATERQWQDLCRLIGRPDLGARTELAHVAGRVAHRDEIDDAIEAWTRTLTKADCVDRVNGANIACGDVLIARETAREPNLRHRAMVRRIEDPDTGAEALVPASPIRGAPWSGRAPARCPPVDADYIKVARLLKSRKGQSTRPGIPSPGRPLDGIRVLEIGQFTNAPLTGKALASFGAEVIKIEPPGGDAGRGWAPNLHGVSYYFMFTNSDKLSLEIDLASAAGAGHFRDLLKSADVLLENMKPGSLTRLGFSPEALEDINPRLIYCPISGFGSDSLYADRPAFDTVVQAMSGIMDLTRHDGRPLKCGPSVCDVGGGQLGLVAILAALAQRDETGEGTRFDLSMQDIGAVFAQTGWAEPSEAPGSLTRNEDGYIYAECGEAVPVLTIAQAAESELTRRRGLVFDSAPRDGKTWPLLRSPIHLSRTPADIRLPIGRPEKLTRKMCKKLGIPHRP